MAQDINHQRRGDRTVDTANFNRLVDAGNKAVRGVDFDPAWFAGTNTPSSQSATFRWRDSEFNFRVAKRTATTVFVFGGRWVRVGGGNKNIIGLTGDGGPILYEYTDGSKILTGLSQASSTFYVILTLTKSGGSATDHVLAPDTMTVTAETTYPTADKFLTTRVIGEVRTDSGGKINKVVNYVADAGDFVTVPDANSPVTATNRNTIEWNTEAGNNKGELQLFDVDTVATDAKAVAYFDEANDSLAWAPPDAGVSSPSNKSIEIVNDILQLLGFATASSTVLSDATNDLILFKDYSEVPPSLAYTTLTDLVGAGGAWGDGNAPWAQAEAIDHGELLGLADDDHDTLYWLMGGSYTRCYGSSIGSNATTIEIDLANREFEEGGWVFDPGGDAEVTLATATHSVDGEGIIETAEYFSCDGNAGSTRTTDVNLIADDGTTLIPVTIHGGIVVIT